MISIIEKIMPMITMNMLISTMSANGNTTCYLQDHSVGTTVVGGTTVLSSAVPVAVPLGMCVPAAVPLGMCVPVAVPLGMCVPAAVPLGMAPVPLGMAPAALPLGMC